MNGVLVLLGLLVLAIVIGSLGAEYLARLERQDYVEARRKADRSQREALRAAMADQRIRLKKMRRPYDWSEGGEL